MKSRAHIYMANLLMSEVEKNGRVKIGDYNYAVPEKICEVLKKYPEYVRAGAIGPDFFPDLIMGQVDIHTKNSGKFLELMYEELTTMRQGAAYDQAFAFYIGFTMHYACDMFSHYYINEYSGGYFPDIASIIKIKLPLVEVDAQKLGIILRHITIESYMDKKVAGDEKDFKIKIPANYLMRCFGTKEAWDKIKAKGIATNSNYQFLRIMVDEYSKALKSGKNVDSRKSQELQERIQVWMTEWQKFAQANVLGKKFNVDKIVDILRRVPSNDAAIQLIQLIIFIYQFEHSPAPVIIDILAGSYLNPITWVEKGMELAFYKALLQIMYNQTGEEHDIPNTINGCKKELHTIIFRYVTEPEKILNESKLFESLRKKTKSNKLTDYFDSEWGNFGKAASCQVQKFKTFRQCLNMGKLCLVGNNNLVKIANEYGAKDYSDVFKDGVFSVQVSKISVCIKVANKAGAGTNRDVHLTVIEKNSAKNKYYLDSKDNDFVVGHEKTYVINLKKKIGINDFKQFKLEVDFSTNTPKFVIDKIVIKDVDSGVTLASVIKETAIKKDSPLLIAAKTIQ